VREGKKKIRMRKKGEDGDESRRKRCKRDSIWMRLFIEVDSLGRKKGRKEMFADID
jgi:hypothetical protein